LSTTHKTSHFSLYFDLERNVLGKLSFFYKNKEFFRLFYYRFDVGDEKEALL
jgi:hypothetical protein